jgi:hypothetical protein
VHHRLRERHEEPRSTVRHMPHAPTSEAPNLFREEMSLSVQQHRLGLCLRELRNSMAVVLDSSGVPPLASHNRRFTPAAWTPSSTVVSVRTAGCELYPEVFLMLRESVINARDRPDHLRSHLSGRGQTCYTGLKFRIRYCTIRTWQVLETAARGASLG